MEHPSPIGVGHKLMAHEALMLVWILFHAWLPFDEDGRREFSKREVAVFEKRVDRS